MLETRGKKETRWKKYQRQQKTARQAYKFLNLFFYLLALGLALGSFRIIFFLKSSLSQHTLSPMPLVSWHLSDCLNLLGFADSEFELIHLCPQEGSLTFLKIPPRLVVSTLAGDYPVQEISLAAKNLNPPQGIGFTIKGVESLLSLPIAGFLKDPRSLIHDPRSLLDYKTLPSIIKGEIEGNLTVFDYLKLVYAKRRIRFDHVLEIEIPQRFLQNQILPSGKEILLVSDEVGFNEFLRKNLSEDRMVKEALKISVFNGTQTTGLGQKAARFIQNLGGDVIEVSNLDNDSKSRIKGLSARLNQTQLIVYGQDKNLYTVKRLQIIFKVKPTFIENIDPQRSDVVVVVGEDLP